MKNQIMLITYGDSLGKNFKEMEEILDKHYKGAIGSIHILPFFPSSADRGFAPERYDKVDEKFGDFADLQRLGKKYELMYDFMVNHISAHSPYYLDFKEKKENSAYKEFFIRYKDFWENGEPTQEQVDKIYKRKPKAPYVNLTFADGSTEKIWCTFGEEQIDLDVNSPHVKEFIQQTIRSMCEHGAGVIRLDAFAYAVKEPDTSCFFVEPKMWELLYEIEDMAKEYEVDILPEIIEAGVYSLKIEGRMKKPEYTAGVVSVYRKYLDKYLSGEKRPIVTKEDKQMLWDIYNRDGFHQSYYKQRNGRSMMALENEKSAGIIRNEELFTRIRKEYMDKKTPVLIRGTMSLYNGCPAILEVQAGDCRVTVEGETVQTATNCPLGEERIRRQMEKNRRIRLYV